MSIPLNDVRKHPKYFDFTDNVVGETTNFKVSGVVVSALTFVPQIGGLLVGFNFGAWQLWNISAVSSGTPISLEFSSEYTNALPGNNNLLLNICTMHTRIIIFKLFSSGSICVSRTRK